MVTRDRTSEVVVTPDNLRGTPAGIATRAAANVVDFALTAGMLVGVYVGVSAFRFLRHPRAFTFPAPSLALIILTGSVAAGLYFAICWSLSGRTYGAYVLGLRVVGHDGRHPSPVVALLRAAACVIFPVGLAWSAVDRVGRSVQDLILHTSVVYDWPEHEPDQARLNHSS
jgi:uncharacterized RDD family membrane protein YckC